MKILFILPVLLTFVEPGKLQDTALQATKDNGLIIDLAMGPNQGAGIPSVLNASGLQWDLQPFNKTVPFGGKFNEVIPGWNTEHLVSASTGLVKSSTNVSSTLTHKLSAESLEDVIHMVSSTGHLNISFSSHTAGEHYVVFTYYLIHTQYREEPTPELVTSGPGVTQSPVTSYVQNGSFVVDHFSAEGAEAVAAFWNDHLLDGTSSPLIKEVGNYIWEDS